MKTIFTTLSMMLVLAFPALVPSADRFKATSDTDFLTKAFTHNQGEAKISNFALQNLRDDKVKDYAQRLVTENKTLNSTLVEHSKRLKVAVLTGEDTETRDRLDTLGKLKGYTFDREYLKQMVEYQGQAIRLYESEVANGSDADLKAMARDVLPSLKKHLEEARKNADRLKE